MATPTEYERSHPLRMCTSKFAGQEGVRIIEVPDKRGPDNRGCTVYASHGVCECMHKCVQEIVHFVLMCVCLRLWVCVYVDIMYACVCVCMHECVHDVSMCRI